MKKLLLFLLFSTAAFAQLNIQPLPDVAVCDPDNDGVTTFDLTTNSTIVLGTLSPAEYTVTYHETLDSAQNNSLSIENPASYTNVMSLSISGAQTLYVRVTENANAENFAVTTLTMRIVPTPVAVALPAINSSNCAGGLYNLTLNNSLYSPQHEVTFYATESDANAGTNAIANPTFYVTNQTMIWVRVANVTTDTSIPICYIILQQQLSYNNNFLIVSVSIDGQTAIVNTTGTVPVNYSIISGPPPGGYPTPYQSSNIFINLEPGTYTVAVQDICANLRYITFTITELDAPTGETMQTFTEGQTLADLEVSGDNIVWYDTPTEGNVLPITTLLVDGTTYYAERSLNRARIANRLAVTVHLVLGTNSNSLQTLSYYPNPAKNTLNINNASPINNVAVFNTLGQQVLNRDVNTTATSLNLATLNAGIYFVKVQAGNTSKTIRIVKE